MRNFHCFARRRSKTFMCQGLALLLILAAIAYFSFGGSADRRPVPPAKCPRRKRITKLRPAGGSLPDLLASEGHVSSLFPHLVKFVGICRVNRSALFCHFHNCHRRKPEASSARFESVLGQRQIEFDGCLISCPVPPFFRRQLASTRVSLSQSKWNPGSARFSLSRIPSRPPAAPTVALCVSPLFGRHTLVRTVAWVEMNRLLGVSHFMFYDFDMDGRLDELMAFYRSKGVVSLLRWNPSPVPVSTQAVWPPPKQALHYYGQFAAYNDCLHRLGNRFRFLMFTDMDEMLVPLKTGRITDVLQRLDGDDVSQFRFRNTYVRADYPKDPRARQLDRDIAAHNVPFLDFTRREKRILDKNVGQKVIVKFQDAQVMGVHELIRGAGRTQDVAVEDALLFHYRSPPQNLNNLSDVGQRSERLAELVPLVLRRVQQVLRQLESLPLNEI